MTEEKGQKRRLLSCSQSCNGEDGKRRKETMEGACWGCHTTRDGHNSSKKKGKKIRSLFLMLLVLQWQKRQKKKGDKRKSLLSLSSD